VEKGIESFTRVYWIKFQLKILVAGTLLVFI